MPKHILYLLILVDFMMTLDCQHPPPKKSKEEEMLLDKLREHYNAQTSINGPAQVKVISQEYNKNMHLKCMVNVTYSGHFSWKLNNKTLSENERVKIEQSKNSSELVIRKINKDDSGIYECIVKSDKASWTPSLYVRVKAPLSIKIRPRDVLLTTETGSFEWNCDNNEGSLENAEYSWYRKLLPGGQWRRIENNNESYVWRIPRTLHTKAESYDVYDLYCEITYRGTTVRGPVARVVITRADAVDTLGFCPEELSEGILWDRTLLGMVDAQLCLEGDVDSGVAKRVCEAFPGRPPTWRIPNLQQCSSPEFNSLKEKFDALTEGFKVNLDIKKTLDELRSLTRPHQQPRPGTNHPARLFGKDLLSTVDILKTTQLLFKKERGKKTLVMETLTSFTETASNILDLENQDTWLEIEEGNPETAADLVTSLDNFGFDLEEDFDGNDDIIENEVQKNLAFEMRRVNLGNRQGREDVIFRQNKSRIVLPRAIFTQESSEAVTVVSVIYDTLASILGDVNTTSNLSNHLALASNSSIISSTIKPLGVGKLKTPVRIVLENDGTSFDEHDQRRCVFWQPEITNSLWSDEGCRLVPENTTKFVTTCECDHCTLFAVMVESGKGGTDSEEQAKLEMISTVGSAISLAAILLTMIIYIHYWKALWSTRFVNFMNLCLAIALVDIFSVLRGPFKEDEGPCTAIGILLHFFVLALFMWMLCEGILLCLLLTDVFKKNYGRKWYLGVHLIGWGLPALIVVTSIGVRGASSYGLSGHCWLSRSHGFLWAAMGPMIVVLLASCSVYGVMLHSVITSQKVQQEDTLGKVKATARASIIIMPVLGFTWTFAILDFFFDELALKYLFAIFNSLQGLFIFLFHCLLNKQVQQAVFKKKRPEQMNILDRVKTQEFRMTGSHDSLESIR